METRDLSGVSELCKISRKSGVFPLGHIGLSNTKQVKDSWAQLAYSAITRYQIYSTSSIDNAPR